MMCHTDKMSDTRGKTPEDTNFRSRQKSKALQVREIAEIINTNREICGQGKIYI